LEELQQKELQNLVKPGTPHEEISETETQKCIDRFDKIRNAEVTLVQLN
jgi:succinate dehydrogenase / fumarate reductase flavoprotein subunit